MNSDLTPMTNFHQIPFTSNVRVSVTCDTSDNKVIHPISESCIFFNKERDCDKVKKCISKMLYMSFRRHEHLDIDILWNWILWDYKYCFENFFCQMHRTDIENLNHFLTNASTTIDPPLRNLNNLALQSMAVKITFSLFRRCFSCGR